MARRIATFVVSLIVWCLLVYPWSAEAGWDGQSILVGLRASALVAATFSDALALHPYCIAAAAAASRILG